MTESLGSTEADPLAGKNVMQYFHLLQDALHLGPLDKEGSLQLDSIFIRFDSRLNALIETFRRNPQEAGQLAIRYINAVDEIIRLSGREGGQWQLITV